MKVFVAGATGALGKQLLPLASHARGRWFETSRAHPSQP
jgi:hypothetical protein